MHGDGGSYLQPMSHGAVTADFYLLATDTLGCGEDDLARN